MAIRLGSAVIVRRGDAILLGQRGKEPNYGKWIVPGGGVHEFESIRDAACREIAEEAGLDIKYGAVISVKEVIVRSLEHRVIVYSTADVEADAEPRASSDLLQARFFSRSELEAIVSDISDVVRELLEETGWLVPRR